MNIIDNETLKKANEEAIYNIYLYLIHKSTPSEHETLKSAVNNLQGQYRKQGVLKWKDRDIYRLRILKNAIKNNIALANSKIENLTLSKSGLTACSFVKENGNVSVVFRGTGSGEWVDNGKALSGISEENTYVRYKKDGELEQAETIEKDYASDRQVEALNWFRYIAAKNSWNGQTEITVSGHSKGGNKAQFITINSDLVDNCYSFFGQGFSPEALIEFKKQYGPKYDERRRKIRSLSSENDYVNVLGERLVAKKNIYYFKAKAGIHYLEAILDKNGNLRTQSDQGILSIYIQKVSKELMSMVPLVREYATSGVMNIFQKYLGEELPVSDDSISTEKTIAGISLAVGSMLHQLYNLKDL